MKPILMLAAAAVSATLLLPTVSHAASGSDQVTVTEEVRYGDLDLTTEKGKAEFQRRINSSIRRVCSDGGALTLDTSASFRRCVQLAKQNSERDMNLALVARSNRARA